MPIGAIAGPIAGAAASFGLSKLFGGKRSKVSSGNAPFSGGGLFGDKKGNITASDERTGLVRNIASTFPQQADFLSGLREQVRPGFSALRASRLEGLEGRRRRAVGNLRENLARRRVLGSSFGQDAVTRSELAFEQEADRIRADSFLQELDLSNQLAQQEFAARRSKFQTLLDELNLQAEVATQLSSKVTAQLGANARMAAELDARAAAGMGSFFGKNVVGPISQAVSGFFGGGGGPTSMAQQFDF